MQRRVLVLGDSLAFHGPERSELLTHPGLFPNVMARALGAEVDVVARLGWTARDAWWALTKDPYVYSVLAPRADAVVLAVGSYDHLPTSIPTYLRDGIARLRPPRLRAAARSAYRATHPHLVRVTGGRLKVLPLPVTLAYLTRSVEALRWLRPERPVVGIVPPTHYSAFHAGNDHGHREVVAAHRAWGARLQVPLVDLDEIVAPYVAARSLNPDGMHWSWEVHRLVGERLGEILFSCPGQTAGDSTS